MPVTEMIFCFFIAAWKVTPSILCIGSDIPKSRGVILKFLGGVILDIDERMNQIQFHDQGLIFRIEISY